MAVHWRKKLLAPAEWSALQEAFGNLQMATGAPADLAMFAKHQPGGATDEIYITGQGIEAIEARAPGGWEDADAPSGDGVNLLVGEGDPWNLFGISKPV